MSSGPKALPTLGTYVRLFTCMTLLVFI
uniref:Uncharacterized protein n=1 Tax=Anguilla anguilla TaxID=7936 RepID=A0A0E9SW88_ANGAN